MLLTIVILLAAAVLMVSLSRRLGVGSILGYLLAGVLIGPAGLHLVTDVASIADISEFGVLMLLFIIGLELRPTRIWAMRRSVFGLGAAQVLACGAVFTLTARLMGQPWAGAAIIGFGLALSSTAIVLPLLSERGLLTLTSGRDAFSVLLFQDLASVPLIALVPILAGQHSSTPIWLASLKVVVAIAAILLGGRFLLRPIFRIIGGTRTRELFTAMALLVVAGAAAVAGLAGLPWSLGAFGAGVVLAESEYRHELQADVEPFEGLLLGFFFMSVGMSANVGLAIRQPLEILLGTLGLLAAKVAIGYGLGRARGQNNITAVRFALAIPQGSEFAFVLFGAAVAAGALQQAASDQATLIVAFSMLLSPIMFALSESRLTPWLQRLAKPAPASNAKDATAAPVVICGFGRFGQIVGRILLSRGIAFNALDAEPDNVETVIRFGMKAYFGDATRLDLLQAVGAETAKVIVVAVDDAAEVLKIVELCRTYFPDAKVFARARNRRAAHLLMDAGVTDQVRETFFSSLRLTELVLKGLDFNDGEARRTVATFRERDEQMLVDQHAFFNDEQQLIQTSAQAAEELKSLFAADVQS